MKIRHIIPIVVLLSPGPALAQTLPEGIASQDSASAGSTDVSKEGFQSAAERDAESTDASEAEVAAGGLIASGNSRQLAATMASKFRVRRDASQFGAAAAINYARAAADKDSELDTSVENLQGNLRYDYFVAKRWSLFLSVSGRRDRFQGLDLRLNVDPGVAYYAIQMKAHRLWFELGYDLQYDIRRDENLDEARAGGDDLEKTETRHSGRGFAGYDNKLNERVSFYTGLEYIQSVQESKSYRLGWDGSLTSNIAGNFSTAVTMSVKYDNNPLPGVETTDILTSFNLVYKLM